MAIAVSVLEGSKAVYQDYQEGSIKNTTKTGAVIVGGWSGGYGGATAGAVLGSMIVPGFGTLLGGLAGGITGSLGGSELGRRLADEVIQGLD